MVGFGEVCKQIDIIFSIIVLVVTFCVNTRFLIMRRAVEEAKKAESSKRIELSLSIIYLLLYNGAQALGLAIVLVFSGYG